MGLISRVSSRTYRNFLYFSKKNQKIMSQAVVWSIVRQNHAYLKKSKKNGGVQFSSHPANLKNKNTLKYSGIANSRTVAIQAAADGKGVTMKLAGKQAAYWKPQKGLRPTVHKAGNAVCRYNPALRAVAKKRASAILKSQRA